MELSGQTAIVTGGGTGIGKAVALELARQGAHIVIAGRREDRLRDAAAEIGRAGGKATPVPTDVTRRADADRLIARAVEATGRLDILFNNAGSFDAIGGLWEVDPEVWWRDVTINLLGPALCTRAALPHMMQRNEGIIINMNGGGSTSPLPGGSAYGSSKAALLRLTETLARELERVGSSVLCVAMGPGFVRTEMTELQADTEAGRRWMPGSKAALDAGKARPAEDCARSTVELLRNLRPEFNGRIFGVGMDFADLARRAAEIKERDQFVLRGH